MPQTAPNSPETGSVSPVEETKAKIGEILSKLKEALEETDNAQKEIEKVFAQFFPAYVRLVIELSELIGAENALRETDGYFVRIKFVRGRRLDSQTYWPNRMHGFKSSLLDLASGKANGKIQINIESTQSQIDAVLGDGI